MLRTKVRWAFPLTSAVAARPLVPPPNPFGASGARLQGETGSHAVRGNEPLRVGRDPSRVAIVLGEVRVSAVHASVKFAEGALWVLDEGSNNGTFVNTVRLNPQVWIRVESGASVAFGPVTFVVVVE